MAAFGASVKTFMAMVHRNIRQQRAAYLLTFADLYLKRCHHRTRRM